jgi:GMP synthase (glutamine-hydrolysing)
MKPLLIIKAGSTYPDIARHYGDFEDWIGECLDLPLTEMITLDAHTTEMFPEPKAISGIVITGSHEMVTDQNAWMLRLSGWLKELRMNSVPTLGICFGHQLLAHTFGGRIEYNARGSETGTFEVCMTQQGVNDPLMNGLPDRFFVQQSHDQEVLILPSDAVLLLKNDHTPNQAFFLSPSVWGVQFHPEFSQEIMRAIIEMSASELRAEGKNPEELPPYIAGTPFSRQIFQNFLQICILSR